MLTYKYNTNHWLLIIILVYCIISMLLCLIQLFAGLCLIALYDGTLTTDFMSIFILIFLPLILMIFVLIFYTRFFIMIKTGHVILYEDRLEYTDKYRNVIIEYSKINYIKLYYSHAMYIISDDSNKFFLRSDLFKKTDFFVEFKKRANMTVKEITIFGLEKKSK